MPVTVTARPPTTQLVLAFTLLYVLWGSSYLAIAVAVTSIPPLTMIAVRFLVAGAILHAICRLRGAPPLTPRQWLSASVVGLLLLVVGTGLTAVAEQQVPSGITSLMIALTPLWMNLLPWVFGQAPPPRFWTWIGLALGLGGVLWMVGPQLSGGHLSGAHFSDVTAGAAPGGFLRGILLLMVASLSWARGSVWSRTLPAPPSPLLSAAAQMWSGGWLLLVIGGLVGEWHGFHLAQVSWASWVSLLYLILAASILAYGSYVFLLRHCPAGMVSTYGFVNPVIAVLLGWLVHDEGLGWRVAGGGTLILIGVILVLIFSGPTGATRSATQRTSRGSRGNRTSRTLR